MKTVKCSHDSGKCMNAAAQACNAEGGTYKVLASSSNAGGIVNDIVAGPVTWYSMSFSCGQSDGKMPEFAFRGAPLRAPEPIVFPRPVATPSAPPRTTNCTTFGNTTNCSSY